MTLIIQKPTGGKLNLSKVYTPIDWEAADYARRVEIADGQPLEDGVFNAINAFILGCKADGIWSAIKASCILTGARTLNGALVPLVGAAPTNFNFVSGDYNRKTGLVGDGSTKYLNSNRNNNADPQDSNHNAVYLAQVNQDPGAGARTLIGATGSPAFAGTNVILLAGESSVVSTRNRSGVLSGGSNASASTLIGTSRASSSSYVRYQGGNSSTVTQSSETAENANVLVFRRGDPSGPAYAFSRLAFYSIGESLDLALLDARVTDLINAFGAAIP